MLVNAINGPHMNALSDSLLLDTLQQYLDSNPLPDELWVFAYGSLLWNPEMSIVETRHGFVDGYERGFNLLSTVHRGTPEQPGLVLSLREGGCCEGVVLKVNPETKMQDFTNLWRREMVTLFYQPRWCEVSTPKGTVRAITFVADPEHKQFVDFDCHTVAEMIYRAHGGRGPNIDYFTNTLEHLASLGIKDPLFESVARYLGKIDAPQPATETLNMA
ncbi:MAG: gamma-glutamylcyclotransferase [Gammaproteobacteria bacterium]|nr:gamma-glutamylcyclotransferase [Gammaproteobacteria bacterium]MCP4880116.1 gamma-glutamylcyclotransferase [Gammaproteobacteria bacterium]MDP6164710.1 gamma-glutamylcyclotransferase [Gammaproteobacteria bacterium]